MITKFTQNQIEFLKYYVYIYKDPSSDEIFYVGKGKGNRVFNHLSDKVDSEKVSRINEIRERGLEPEIEILIHGLEDEKSSIKS